MRQRIHVSASTMLYWLAIQHEVNEIVKEKGCGLVDACWWKFNGRHLATVPFGVMKYALRLQKAEGIAITIVDCDRVERCFDFEAGIDF